MGAGKESLSHFIVRAIVGACCTREAWKELEMLLEQATGLVDV
jgi:hypothetical protein